MEAITLKRCNFWVPPQSIFMQLGPPAYVMESGLPHSRKSAFAGQPALTFTIAALVLDRDRSEMICWGSAELTTRPRNLHDSTRISPLFLLLTHTGTHAHSQRLHLAGGALPDRRKKRIWAVCFQSSLNFYYLIFFS